MNLESTKDKNNYIIFCTIWRVSLCHKGLFPVQLEEVVTSACFSSASLLGRLLVAAWWSISIKHWVRQRWQHQQQNPVSGHSAKGRMIFQWPSIPSLSPQPALNCKDSLSKNAIHLSNAEKIKKKTQLFITTTFHSALEMLRHSWTWESPL